MIIKPILITVCCGLEKYAVEMNIGVQSFFVGSDYDSEEEVLRFSNQLSNALKLAGCEVTIDNNIRNRMT